MCRIWYSLHHSASLLFKGNPSFIAPPFFSIHINCICICVCKQYIRSKSYSFSFLKLYKINIVFYNLPLMRITFIGIIILFCIIVLFDLCVIIDNYYWFQFSVSSPPSNLSSLTNLGTVGSCSSLHALRPQGTHLTPSLLNHYRDDLVNHVRGWPADALEKQV